MSDEGAALWGALFAGDPGLRRGDPDLRRGGSGPA